MVSVVSSVLIEVSHMVVVSVELTTEVSQMVVV